MQETTLVLIKPDGVRRGLVGRIIARLEDKGLAISGARLLQLDRELARRHYQEHAQKPFYAQLVDFITSGPVLALAVTGKRAIKSVRGLVGATDPLQAAPGTIRGDFAWDKGQNLVHASDSPQSAARELALFFRSEEIIQPR